MTWLDIYWLTAPLILAALCWGWYGIARWRHWL
jgi:hypothetical protein